MNKRMIRVINLYINREEIVERILDSENYNR